jgi:hypothetical protein
MTNPTFPYQGVLVRDSLSDTGSEASTGCVYQSPDIIPYGDDILSLQSAVSTYDSDIGKGLSTGSSSVNYIFVRAKNLNAANQTATVSLYRTSASLLNAPDVSGIWEPVLTASGKQQNSLVVSGDSTTIPSDGIALTEEAFTLDDLTPPPNDHYCLMAIVDDPDFSITTPPSWPTNSAFASWVGGNPAVAWRNVTQYKDTSNAFSGIYQFGNINGSPEAIAFIVSCDSPYLPSGTTVKVTCTNSNFPLSMSHTVSAAPRSGTQRIPFIPSQNIPANFAAALTIEIVPSASNPIPSGLSIQFSYYQIPNSDIELDAQMARPVTFVDDTGATQSNALVFLGAVTIVTK